MLDDAPTQDDLSTENIDDFMARRRQAVADAALGRFPAHQDDGDALQNSPDLGQSPDLTNYSARFGGFGLLGPVGQSAQGPSGQDIGLPSAAQTDGGDGLDIDPSQSPDSTNYMASLFGGGLLGPVGQPPQGQYGGGVELQPGAQAQSNPPGEGDNPAPQPPGGDGGEPTSTPKSDLHPGLVESLIPVWGSGKEAYADFKDGNYAGAALNGLLAGSDLFLAGDIAKAFAKGGLYALRGPLFEKAWRQDWREVSKEMRARGMLEPGQKGNAGKEGHHWAIPQKNQWIPDFIKNHPLNIKELPKPIHRRITGRWQGAPQFNLLEGYWHGTPTWSKVATVDAAGHPIAAATADDPDQ